MKKVLGFAAALMFVSSSAFAGMGINVSQFSLDGMAGSGTAGVHYDLDDASAGRVNLGIANEGDKMFKDIDLHVAYRMFSAKSGAVRPFMQGSLGVNNATDGDNMGISVGGGLGGEWFYNDNISLELSTGLSFNMDKQAGTPADPVTGAAATESTSVNSVVTWTSGVGFNLYW